MSGANKITDKKDLVAGILYCLFTREWDSVRDREYDCSGGLLYWTGECFMDEDGDERYDDWDYVVAQSCTPNAEYVVHS